MIKLFLNGNGSKPGQNSLNFAKFHEETHQI